MKNTRGFIFRLYLVFVVSWFLHIPTRIKPLGVLRVDLMLLAAITLGIFFTKKEADPEDPMAEAPPATTTAKTQKIIKIMFAYIFITLPFVQWPGSVLFTGLPNWIRALVFYFFTISLVTTEKRLRTFMKVFLTCQSIRVIEPVVLHLTTGYWGSVASMSNWEAMDRLSGAPSDVVNPNGLAFVILMVLPFLHFLTSVSWKNKVIYAIMAPTLIYALLLTASRTGFVCLLFLLGLFWLKSSNKMILLIVFVVTSVVSVGLMSDNLKDRYLSIADKNTNNAVTAEGRMTQFKENMVVGMRKPFIGHGLGTSLEANANYGTYGKIAHNLIAEIFEELGAGGLILFTLFVKSIIANFRESMAVLRKRDSHDKFLQALTDAMQCWLYMNIMFSLASFGLSSYEWYLFGGLSICLRNVALEGLTPEQVEEILHPKEETPNPWAEIGSGPAQA